MNGTPMTAKKCKEQSEILMDLANSLEARGDTVGAALNRQLAGVYLDCAESGLYLDGTPLAHDDQEG
jgi:hypothetical protein